MVMKDKLVKTNHKGIYYIFKRSSIVLFALASLTFAIAVPTYIVANSKAKKTNVLAEEKSSEVVENDSNEEVSEYDSYNG